MKRSLEGWARRWTRASASVILIAAAQGCASGPPKSGFLDDYSGFEEMPEDAQVWDYINTDRQQRDVEVRLWGDRRNIKAMGNYNRLMVDPIVVNPLNDASIAYVPQARLDEISRFMRETIVDAFHNGYQVVDEPGEGVLRLRTALTDVSAEYVYVIPDPDKHPVKAWMNSTPARLVTEGEAVDSVTGERVFGLIADARGSYHPSAEGSDEWEEPRQIVRGLARCLRKLLDDAHAAN